MSKTIIISNRLPINLEIDNNTIISKPSVGGLATGMKSVHQSGDSIWIGWSGITDENLDEHSENLVKNELKKHKCVPVNLSEKEVNEYYFGFSNRTIWPLFHYFTEYTEYKHKNYKTYKAVNKKFAQTVIDNLNDDDTVWIHDYQLFFLPQLIKEQKPNVSIGFFLHIPFPSYEVFRILPWRKQILKGLLGADLIGFHTYDYERHFLSSVQRILGFEIEFNTVVNGKQITTVDTFPMGIDYEKFSQAALNNSKQNKAENSDVQNEIYKHLDADKGAKLILSIDRLDYTKGIANRLRAFEFFLDNYPQYHQKVRLVLLAVPSRANVPQYQKLKNEIDQLVGRINGKFAEVSWTPIWYFYRSMPFENLIDLYTSSDVALITPVRDGMNLVAKEYVATRTDKTGVLILSEMAGAAAEMGEAILINPNNFEEIASSLHQALSMPVEEQISRNETLQKRLKRYNVNKWANSFFEALNTIKEDKSSHSAKYLNQDNRNQLITDFTKAKNRILFLDYDGTLAPFVKIPSQAKPTPILKERLEKLSSLPNTKVVLITGRDKDTFNTWFGESSQTLITEHGAWLKEVNQDWELLEPLSNEWFSFIEPILESFTDRTPGSIIETKKYSLAWHFRNVDPELGNKRANDLKVTLQQLIANHNLEILEGDKVLEIKTSGVNKGKSACKMLINQEYDFILSMGDDWTDEYMFKELPQEGYSIKVGLKPTVANYYVTGCDEVENLLKTLID